jgi:rRNA maturation RNase YbeY
LKINIFYDEVKYRLRNVKKIKKLIIKVIRNENMFPGDLNIIVTTDRNIREINRKFLKRDNFTDVIAFDYGNGNNVNGEVYISIDTVKINANKYKVSFNIELLRVIIHGTLHLCGYSDKDEEEKQVMHRMEEKWMENFNSE